MYLMDLAHFKRVFFRKLAFFLFVLSVLMGDSNESLPDRHFIETISILFEI